QGAAPRRRASVTSSCDPRLARKQASSSRYGWLGSPKLIIIASWKSCDQAKEDLAHALTCRLQLVLKRALKITSHDARCQLGSAAVGRVANRDVLGSAGGSYPNRVLNGPEEFESIKQRLEIWLVDQARPTELPQTVGGSAIRRM